MSNENLSHSVWWHCEKGSVCEEVVGVMLDLIVKSDRERRENLAAWWSLYMDYPLDYEIGQRIFNSDRVGKSANNVLTGAIDTTVAKLITSRPAPQVLSEGGDWSIRNRVKLLNQWSKGQWERLKLHPLMDVQVLDAAIFGTGCIKHSPKNGAPHAERVWCGHLWVDPREEFHGCVRTLYQYAGKDREELAAAFPEHAEHIMSAQKVVPMDGALFDFMPNDMSNTADLVAVVEAWRLPTSPDKPGRHVICVDGADLLDEEWEHDMFPFSFMRWGVDPMRFWGQGMIERGSGPQLELNELCTTTREAYERWFPCWLIPKGTTMPEKMSDEVGGVYGYDPALGPPQYYTPGAVGPEVTNQVYALENRIRSTIGVSDMDSAGVEAQHEMSGKARLVKKDMQSIRFGREGRNYEEACVDNQKALMLVADNLADDADANLDVYGGDKVLEKIEFGEARLKKDTVFRVRVEPVNKMADTLTGKLEQVNMMQQSGMIKDPKRLERLVDLPDIAADGERSQSGRDIVDRAIEDCLNEKPRPAHAYMDTAYGVTRAIQELNLAEMQGATPEGLDHLRNFIGHLISIEDKKKAAAAAMAAPAGPAPANGAPPADMAAE